MPTASVARLSVRDDQLQPDEHDAEGDVQGDDHQRREPAEPLDARENEPREHEDAEAEAVGDPDGRSSSRSARMRASRTAATGGNRGLDDRALVPADLSQLGEREMLVSGPPRCARLCAYTCASQKTAAVTASRTTIFQASCGIGLHPADEHGQREDRAVDEPAEPLAERRAAGRRDAARLLEDPAQGAPGCLVGIRRLKKSERIAITPRIASAERSPLIRAS